MGGLTFFLDYEILLVKSTVLVLVELWTRYIKRCLFFHFSRSRKKGMFDFFVLFFRFFFLLILLFAFLIIMANCGASTFIGNVIIEWIPSQTLFN